MASRSQPVLASNGQGEGEPSAALERLTRVSCTFAEHNDRDGVGWSRVRVGDICEALGRIEVLEACLRCDDESVRTAWAREAQWKADRDALLEALTELRDACRQRDTAPGLESADRYTEALFGARDAIAKAGTTERQPEPREESPSPKVTGDAS